MASKILVPELGESVIEATVARWLKAEGDAVVIGDPLVELETDKVSVEVGAEQAGVLAKILKADGQDVRVGEEIGIIEEVLGAAQAGSPPKAAPKPKQAAETPAEVARPPAKGGANAAPPPVDPKRSEEAVVDERLSRIQPLRGGSAPEVPRAGTSNAGAMAAPQSSPPAAPPAAPVGTARRVAGERREEVVRLSRRRRTIAQRLVEAQRTAAMLTTFNEVDMGAVMEMRAAYKDAFKERHGVGLGILSFFVKATVVALKAVPPLNSEIRGDDLVLKHFHDIGVAVGAAEGLIVPVLRDADLMSFAEIERAIKEYARRSEEGSISLEDLRGGTFTITNGGVFGSLFSTPILNPPEVGILGLHKVEERPVAVKGQVVVRPMMYVALTYDHRVVDGREAVTFLMKVKEAVEDPRRLLLEM